MTIASVAAGSNLRRHLFAVLIALSAALNLFFIVGALWIRINGPPMPLDAGERLHYIGEQLGLDPRQKEAFDRYSQAVRSHMQAMHKTVDPLVGKAWMELAKPDADEAKVVESFDEAGQARRGFMRELAPITLSFLATLSPEQRARFVDLIRKKTWEHGH
ncbi:MAG: Spy/CpxP family protein refolding chaperone [Stellaceae bacterium]